MLNMNSICHLILPDFGVRTYSLDTGNSLNVLRITISTCFRLLIIAVRPDVGDDEGDYELHDAADLQQKRSFDSSLAALADIRFVP
jgi:hypothetical protein